MKGITHFICGLLVGTSVSVAVEATIAQKSLIILLGGIFGILPDTLDFRISRYVQKHHYEIEPIIGGDVNKLDPHLISVPIARAIDEAYYTGRTVNVKLHTIKLGADLWRQCSVTFDSHNRRVIGKIGPVVTTGQNPYPASIPPNNTAETSFSAPILHTYEEEIKWDIFSGPDFAFVREGDHVRIDFLPWHRTWAHSLTLGLLLGPIGFLIYGLNLLGFAAFVIIVGAFWAHVIVDQMGMLGSNLFWPITRKRSRGWRLINHASDVLPNVVTNYTAIMMILWNLNAFSSYKYFTLPLMTMTQNMGWWAMYLLGGLNYVLVFILLPMGLLYALYRYYFREEYIRTLAQTTEALRASEIMYEAEDLNPR